MELPRAVADNYELRKHLHEIHSLAEHDSAAALRRFNEIFYPENCEEQKTVSEEDALTALIVQAEKDMGCCTLTIPCTECSNYIDGFCEEGPRLIARALLHRDVKLPTEE